MKTKYIIQCVALCFSVITLVSCESHEQKADEAFEKVKEDKKMGKDSGSSVGENVIDTSVKEVTEEPAKPEIVIKTVNSDEWSKFRAEIDKKILTNENKIKAIKTAPEPNAKLLSELTSLEKDYNDLKRKMDEYHEEVKQELGKFKLKMNHEVNEIGIELDDKINSNKK